MNQKLITADCLNCESGYEVSYMQELVSSDLPQHCPFCGEPIEDITEEYIDDDSDFGDDDWDEN